MSQEIGPLNCGPKEQITMSIIQHGPKNVVSEARSASPSPRTRSIMPLTSSEISTYYRVRVPRVQQVGTEWRGPCPIHDGNRDSFAVNPETGTWYCHSACATGGNVFTLEEKLGGETGKDAAR